MQPVEQWLPDWLPQHIARFGHCSPPWPKDLMSMEGVVLVGDYARMFRALAATYAEADSASKWLKDNNKDPRFQEKHPNAIRETITALRAGAKPPAAEEGPKTREEAEWQYRNCPLCSGSGLAWIDAPASGAFQCRSAGRKIPFEAPRAVFTCDCPAGTFVRAGKWPPQLGGCPYPDLNNWPELSKLERARWAPRPDAEPARSPIPPNATARGRLRIVAAYANEPELERPPY